MVNKPYNISYLIVFFVAACISIAFYFFSWKIGGIDFSLFTCTYFFLVGSFFTFAFVYCMFSGVGSFGRILAKLGLVYITLCSTIIIFELFFRVIGFDFRRQEAQIMKVPPFYRMPDDPCGEVFFKRKGNLEWHGNVIMQQLNNLGYTIETTEGEEVSVRYDKDGFRNEVELSDWEVAVAGDSFTELGYLSYTQLFTSVLSRYTGLRVKNLGVSCTGPLTQLCYLKFYGLSRSLKHGVIVFFEGNDITDLSEEYFLLKEYMERAQRPYRQIRKQSSFILAVYELLYERNKIKKTKLPIDAYYVSPNGKVPLTLYSLPLTSSAIPVSAHEGLDVFLREFQMLAQKHKFTPWLFYMPDRIRVYYKHLIFPESVKKPVVNWKPTDLPLFISNKCAQFNINFVDLTPDLIREAESTTNMLYHAQVDSHLTAEGSCAVGKIMAKYLKRPEGDLDNR